MTSIEKRQADITLALLLSGQEAPEPRRLRKGLGIASLCRELSRAWQRCPSLRQRSPATIAADCADALEAPAARFRTAGRRLSAVREAA